MNIFTKQYYDIVLGMAKLKFGNKNIKSRKIAEDVPLLGAYRIALKDGKKYIGYLNYKTEKVEFNEVKEQ